MLFEFCVTFTDEITASYVEKFDVLTRILKDKIVTCMYKKDFNCKKKDFNC